MAGTPKVAIFNPADTMTDIEAEAEELQQGGGEPTPEPAPGSDTPTPVPAEGPSPAPQGEQPDRTIPYQRFQEVINERNRLRQAEADLREKWARLEERGKQAREINERAQRAEAEQRQQAERPDPSIDPVGAQLFDITRQNHELLAWKQQQEQQFNQLQQAYQVDRQTQDFNNWVVAEAQNFSQTQPDYSDAARHAAEWRMGVWQELGLPPEMAREMVIRESNLLAQISRQSGKPFAPVIYKLAQAVGYKATGTQNGNGAPTPQAVSNAGKLLAQVAKGQTMQGIGRVAAGGAESKSRYRDMSAADIGAVSEAQWQRDWSNPQLRPDMEYALRKLDGLLEHEDVSYGGRGDR